MISWIKQLFGHNDTSEMIEDEPVALSKEEQEKLQARLKVYDDSMRALIISLLLRGVERSYFEGELSRIATTVQCGELLDNTIEVDGFVQLNPVFAQTLRFLPDEALQVKFGAVIKVEGKETTRGN